jgi:hypothetical protein
MAQVAPPDRGEIQALPPRRRLPRLGYLTDSGGVGQDVQGVLQRIEVRPRAPCALAAQMTRVIALAALGLSEAPVHEPVQGEAAGDIRGRNPA